MNKNDSVKVLDFDKCRKTEENGHKNIAVPIYTALSCGDVVFTDFNNENGRVLQKMDVDVILTMFSNGKELVDKKQTKYISEKHHTYYHNLYKRYGAKLVLEYYSSFEMKTLGWTRKSTAADLLVITYNSLEEDGFYRYLEMPYKKVKDVYNDIIIPAIPKSYIEEKGNEMLHETNDKNKGVCTCGDFFIIDNEKVYVETKVTRSGRNNRYWHTLLHTIPLSFFIKRGVEARAFWYNPRTNNGNIKMGELELPYLNKKNDFFCL